MSMLQRFSAPKLQWVALICLLIYPIAILAARLDIWHFRNSFLLFVIAALIGFGVLVVSVLKLAKSQEGDAKPLVVALIATAIPLGLLGNSIMKAQSHPFIHDISTDTQTPPEFVAAKADRAEGDHDVAYAGDAIASLQREGYPDLTSVTLSHSPQQVFELAKGLVQTNGWALLAENNQQLPYTLEAVDTSLMFGFKDDVVIRINEGENGSIVDVRSMSRQGKSDLGVNAKRIRAFLEQLSK